MDNGQDREQEEESMSAPSHPSSADGEEKARLKTGRTTSRYSYIRIAPQLTINQTFETCLRRSFKNGSRQIVLVFDDAGDVDEAGTVSINAPV